jgi:hypothetical protein
MPQNRPDDATWPRQELQVSEAGHPRNHGAQHSAYANCMLPVAVSQTQRSKPVNATGESGKLAAPVDARFSDRVAPLAASQLPLTGNVLAGQTCWHSTPEPVPQAV